jgi:hypothetical protein
MTPPPSAILRIAATALIAALWLSPAIAQQTAAIEGEIVKGWLDLRPHVVDYRPGTQLIITGHAFSPLSARGHYVLEVTRRGRSAAYNSRQTGTFAVAPGRTIVLGQTVINCEHDDQLHITLRLFDRERKDFDTVVQIRFPASR